jgi:ketopantoate hydroxymethyltransferase
VRRASSQFHDGQDSIEGALAAFVAAVKDGSFPDRSTVTRVVHA